MPAASSGLMSVLRGFMWFRAQALQKDKLHTKNAFTNLAAYSLQGTSSEGKDVTSNNLQACGWIKRP